MQNRNSTILPGNDAAGTFFPNRRVGRLFPVKSLPELVSAADFVDAMRGAVTGVNIATTDGAAGRFGVTVSAFSSV